MASRPATTVERTYASFYVPDVHGALGHDQVVLKHPNGLCIVCLSPEHPMCAAAGSSGGRAGDASTGKRKRGGDDGRVEGDAEARDASAAPGAAAEATASPAREARPDATSPEDDERGVAPMEHSRGRAREESSRAYAALAAVDFSCGKDGADDGASVGAVFVSGKKKRGAKTLMENSGVCALIDEDSRRWIARACVRGKLLERNDALVRQPELARADPLGRGFLVILEPKPEDLERLRRSAMDKSAYDARVAQRRRSAKEDADRRAELRAKDTAA